MGQEVSLELEFLDVVGELAPEYIVVEAIGTTEPIAIDGVQPRQDAMVVLVATALILRGDPRQAVAVRVLPYGRGTERVFLQSKRPRLLEQRIERVVLGLGGRERHRERDNEEGRKDSVAHQSAHCTSMRRHAHVRTVE